MRDSALKVIRELGIEGGCNIQHAWRDDGTPGGEYRVVEVNPRVSRSSALASKATGYPIARVTAKVALGKRLHEITNEITGEPTLSSQRYTSLDETAFNEFDATYSADSLTITIDPGEAFVDGWLARDEPTDIDLATNDAGQKVVIGWNPDVIYDDQ
jgi:hypothetical protein